ncbi:MAG: hypothetical protein VW582_08300, partial [Rhodospirillaceae bacterium]
MRQWLQRMTAPDTEDEPDYSPSETLADPELRRLCAAALAEWEQVITIGALTVSSLLPKSLGVILTYDCKQKLTPILFCIGTKS